MAFVSISSVHERILELSVRAMEGRFDSNDVTAIIGNFENISQSDIVEIIHAAADLYWYVFRFYFFRMSRDHFE